MITPLDVHNIYKTNAPTLFLNKYLDYYYCPWIDWAKQYKTWSMYVVIHKLLISLLYIQIIAYYTYTYKQGLKMFNIRDLIL